MSGVLQHIRVLDLSWGISGPIATMVFSDQGADVIKIEPPSGDPFSGQLGYRAWQRGKRNATYDLKDSNERKAFLDLVKTADVLVESFSPGTTAELGIDYATLSTVNPRLVYCSITGYGRDNPLSLRPAYDALVAARTGLHFEQRGRNGGVFHFSNGEPPFADFEFAPDGVVGPRPEDRDGPLFPATFWPSLGAAYAAMTAVSAALLVRAKTGRGQWVETSLLQGALTAGTMAFSYAKHPEAPHYSTWVNDSRSPKGNFECADGRWLIHWVPNPSFVLGATEGSSLNPSPDTSARQDPDRIMPAVDDMLVLDHYYPMLKSAIHRFTADEWSDAAAVAGQCMQKVRSPEEALSDSSFIEDGCVVTIEDPKLGTTRQAGTLYRLEKNLSEPRSGISEFGADNAAVRAEAARSTSWQTTAPTQTSTLSRPLEGVRVLDLGLAIAGPFGAQILSDLGADVIKINATYDWYWHSNVIAMSANRGKRSLAVDIRKPEGIRIVQQLAETADVVIHNMRYKAVEGRGLDYEALKEINPRLIYCHTRGFERGSREHLPGNDQTGSALAGVQWEDGGCADGGRPYWSLTSLGDTGNGYLAAIAIIQALLEREKTGEGQFVDTSIVNAQLLNASQVIARDNGTGFPRPRLTPDGLGYNSAGYRLYPTQSGYLCLALVNEGHWQSLFRALPGGDYARYADPEAREADNAALMEWIGCQLATKPAEDWFAVLDAAGVPCEISNPEFSREIWKHADAAFLLDRSWLVKLPHRVLGEVGHVGIPYSLSETPAGVQSSPLIVGEQSREVLLELGIEPMEVDRLFAEGVVVDERCYAYDLDECSRDN
ncbi:CoA transferase [Parahaliea maris]|uniref:CoA transferase n=1 Tax=Parahaliea maris TaxID=2716870 RepID=A0A5C9A8F0_9GAMM|nr:CoA transferase [Parahaliea maris]TXS95837.1 CoA transferase [Parahaliea maris]